MLKRRSFLAMLSSLPLLGWVKPKPAPVNGVTLFAGEPVLWNSPAHGGVFVTTSQGMFWVHDSERGMFVSPESPDA